MNPAASMLHLKFKNNHTNDRVDNICQVNTVDEAEAPQNVLVRKQKMLEDVENTGREMTYRCNKCRTCKVCKQHPTDKIKSVKEEVEQDLINKSVKVDKATQITTASLS